MKKYSLYLYLYVFCHVYQSAQAQKQINTITPNKVYVYKKTKQKNLTLEVFEPKNHKTTDKRTAIIFFFGGGWVRGTTKQFKLHAKKFAEQGFVSITADYRTKLSPFVCVEDGKSAIRWVRANAKKLGIHADRIIAAGGSAGGHVAACTAIIEGHEKGNNLTISSKSNALILYNPVIDTTEKGYGLKLVGEKRKTEVSPCHHVKKGIAPTLIFHGTKDTTVPIENITRFTELMKKEGNFCKLIPFQHKGHGFFNNSYFRKGTNNKVFYETMKHALTFLKEIKWQDSKK